MKKVVIVGDTIGLPVGYASSTRTQFIASALTKIGVPVDIFLIKPSEPDNEIKNHRIKFSLCNATVWYTCGTTTLNRNWFKRRYDSFIGLFNACKNIYIDNRNIQSVVIYSRNIEVVFVIGLIARYSGVKSVLELCEWPLTQSANNAVSRFKKRLFCMHALKFVDGVVHISQFIHKKIIEFDTVNNKKTPTFYLPILCDYEEFRSTVNSTVTKGMILYCGNLSYRSLLDRTLKIMSQVISKDRTVTITIVGSSDNKEDTLHLKNKIQHYNIPENVIVKGYVSRQELISLYKSAYAFLLPLEDDDLSVARFPTKLAEYLLSGRPVITPDIGEISSFLTSNVSFIAPVKNDTVAFATCLTRLLSNSDIADEIGSAGKRVAMNSFDYRCYGQSLSNWLIDLG